MSQEDNLDFLDSIEDSNKNPNKENESEKVNKKDSAELVLDNNIPELRGSDYSDDFKNMVKRIQNQYRMLPILDYESIDHELREAMVVSKPTPTLSVLHDEIQKIQAYKERICEIFMDVTKNYVVKKRAVDLLLDVWNSFSDQSSADKRKGDAQFRMSEFILDLSEVEACMKSCQHVVNSQASAQENISRRITIMQIQTKVGDQGRHFLPDWEPNYAENKSDKDIDDSVGLEPESDVF